MKCLVVLAAFLIVRCECYGFYPAPLVPKLKPFRCQAPNNKGLQAAFDEFDKYRVEDLRFLADSYALIEVKKILRQQNSSDSDRFESLWSELETYFCEKVFVDLEYYVYIFIDVLVNIQVTADNMTIPAIEESQYGEDFTNYVNKIYCSEKYKRSRKILDYHIAMDEYAALGMRRLRSLECKKLIMDLMSTDGASNFLSTLEGYGIYYDDLVDLFVYLTLSSWEYETE